MMSISAEIRHTIAQEFLTDLQHILGSGYIPPDKIVLGTEEWLDDVSDEICMEWFLPDEGRLALSLVFEGKHGGYGKWKDREFYLDWDGRLRDNAEAVRDFQFFFQH